MLVSFCYASHVFPELLPQKAPVFDSSSHGVSEMKLMRFSMLLLAALAITFSLAVCAKAQTFTILAAFNGTNGNSPFYGSLIQGTNGDYYGTTSQGGKYGGGVVFKVTPSGKLTDLYSFCAQTGCSDGMSPWTSLVLGSDGNFYGTTNRGGHGVGTVFKMTLGGKLTTLYSFCPATGCTDGANPVGLVQASNGSFYGTTQSGGATGFGTVFEVSSAGTFKKLYTFCSSNNCVDGLYPLSAPMQSTNGNLYGTTNGGGSHGSGVVYEITTAGVFKVLYNFCSQANCSDGEFPVGGLIHDLAGNFYGTTQYGGNVNGWGTVFEITTTNQLIILHSFDNTDGAYPLSALLQASDGNFYGTTSSGGGVNNAGTIFEITSGGVFSSLYSLCLPSSCNGSGPQYALAQATDGTFIGTTSNGGSYGDGNVFSYSTGLGPLVETVPVAAKVGKRIIILGNGLTGSTSVTFNGTTATFTVVSNTEITATVPTGATTGTVTVTTPTGTLNSNPAFQVLD
jgi:uncharacterized repeat protein (TIGR03803 family)